VKYVAFGAVLAMVTLFATTEELSAKVSPGKHIADSIGRGEV